jgi:hypothetical protein
MVEKKKFSEKQLLEFFRSLDEDDQKAVINFAGYLYEKNPKEKKATREVVNVARPQDESVIGAIKRLKKTYPMVESMNVLNKVSELLSAHMLQGRDKISVIDELELLFRETYESQKSKSDV